jgi:VCBS repeat-containing protein
MRPIRLNNPIALPQAKADDLGLMSEENVAFSVVNLLSNDAGGSSTQLWAIGANAWDKPTDSALVPFRVNGSDGWSVLISYKDGEFSVSDLMKDGTKVSDTLDGLPEGANPEFTFHYMIRMGNGAFSQTTAKFQIQGENDAAELGASGQSSAEVFEDGVGRAEGSLNISDNDYGQSFFTAGELVNAYGTFLIDENGSWSFTLDNDSDAVQGLDTGESHTLHFDVRALDGTLFENAVTIFIRGLDEERSTGKPEGVGGGPPEGVGDGKPEGVGGGPPPWVVGSDYLFV